MSGQLLSHTSQVSRPTDGLRFALKHKQQVPINDLYTPGVHVDNTVAEDDHALSLMHESHHSISDAPIDEGMFFDCMSVMLSTASTLPAGSSIEYEILVKGLDSNHRDLVFNFLTKRRITHRTVEGYNNAKKSFLLMDVSHRAIVSDDDVVDADPVDHGNKTQLQRMLDVQSDIVDTLVEQLRPQMPQYVKQWHGDNSRAPSPEQSLTKVLKQYALYELRAAYLNDPL